jgi:chromosome segregation protein
MKDLKTRDLEQVARQLEELARREASDQQQLTELTATMAELEARVKEAEAAEARQVESLTAAEKLAQEGQARWDEFTLRAEAPLYQAEGERVRVQTLERSLAQTQERLERLRGERSSLDAAPIQSSLFDADTELETLNRELSNGQSRLAELDRQVQQLRDARSAEEGALHEARQSLQSARGRVASLETLQQAALREDDAELQQWLREQRLDTAPRLASVLQVDAGWERAVEHVLGPLLQAPILSSFSGRLPELPAPPKSGVTLVDEHGEFPAAQPGHLGQRVRGSAAVTELLGGILTEESPEAAARRAAHLKPGQSVITPDGVWRGLSWIRYPRATDDQGGVLARGVLLRELQGEVAAQGAAVQRHEQTLEQLQTRLQAAEAERAQLATHFDSGRNRQAQRMAFRQAQAVRLEQTESRVRQLQQELDGLRGAQDQQQQELAGARSRLTELEAVAQRLREERAELQQALTQQREALAAVRAQSAQLAATRSQAQVQLAGRQSALDALRRAQDDLAARRQDLVAQRARYEEEAVALDAPIANQSASMDGARAAVETEREALRVAREAVVAAESRLTQCLQAAREAEYAQDAAREKLQQAQLEFQTLSVRRQTLEDQIGETGFERDALLAELSAEATPEACEERLGAMVRRIERLGAINLAAIGELEEGEQREKYLTDQNNDLTGALETLESAIRKIDAETKERFKTTFDKVDAIFRERFPKLFGGGEAYLELTGEDILETGVRVMARPPGKRNSSIQLLSGGEKAMTAVALLLALFSLNPAPFCMLDEVDAPLDDANVGRFVETIREMSANVQFIIITHNKISMELAEQLHGVTMQEPGVSRLVSVDIQQAMDLAAKNEGAEAAA